MTEQNQEPGAAPEGRLKALPARLTVRLGKRAKVAVIR
jgi:hypothetical protein